MLTKRLPLTGDELLELLEEPKSPRPEAERLARTDSGLYSIAESVTILQSSNAFLWSLRLQKCSEVLSPAASWISGTVSAPIIWLAAALS